ncbi:MAG: hypothetical protein ACK4PR_05645 [Gammaproteobacteria bacterium]
MMVKIPKFSDLTDMEKLKQLGNSLVDTSKVSGLVDKVKSTVSDPNKMGDLVGRVKTSVGLGDKPKTETSAEESDSLQAQANAIQQSLQALYDAQKQQLAIMNALKKQVNHLIASSVPPSPSPSASAETHTESESQSAEVKDNVHDDTV